VVFHQKGYESVFGSKVTTTRKYRGRLRRYGLIILILRAMRGQIRGVYFKRGVIYRMEF
jgi:hypothetical protein